MDLSHPPPALLQASPRTASAGLLELHATTQGAPSLTETAAAQARCSWYPQRRVHEPEIDSRGRGGACWLLSPPWHQGLPATTLLGPQAAAQRVAHTAAQRPSSNTIHAEMPSPLPSSHCPKVACPRTVKHRRSCPGRVRGLAGLTRSHTMRSQPHV